jgi:CheY-like chemotaxis protein
MICGDGKHNMKLRVMAVDDDREILNLLKAHLEFLQCEVVDLTDSAEAAVRLQKEKIDGMFVDVTMPGVDGFTLTKMVRGSKLNRRVPIVMLTGLDDAKTMRKGFESGADFFLGKPFTRERIYRLMGATRGPMTREQHRYARIPYQTAVQLAWGNDSQPERKTQSLDISEGGMLLSPPRGLAVDQEFKASFNLPGASRPIKADAVVVRLVPPDGMGIKFRRLDHRDEKELQSYVRARLEE